MGSVEASAVGRSGGCALLGAAAAAVRTCLCLLALNVLILRDLSLFQQIKRI